MNQIVAQQPVNQLPAHLAALYQQPAVSSLGTNITAGISSGAHNRISIKQSRWRLMDTQGGETVVQTFNLDVLLVDANPHTSKTFYEGGYNPNAQDNQAPRCWSDNGVAPSNRVANPCAYVCASCPMNAFGSKITESGKKAKMCGDSKRVAVVLADNPDGLIYELRVPAASLTNMANAINDMLKRGERPEFLVWSLTFDPQAEFPKITFTPKSYINEVQLATIQRLADSKETADIVNKNDQPIEAGRQLTAPVAPVGAPPVPQGAAPTQAPVYAQQPVQQLPQQQPVQYAQSAAPLAPALSVSPAFNPAGTQAMNPATASMAMQAPMMAQPTVGQPVMQPAFPSNGALNVPMQPLAIPPAMPQIQATAMPEKPKRTRRSAAEVAAEKAAKAQAAGIAPMTNNQQLPPLQPQQPQQMQQPFQAPAMPPMQPMMQAPIQAYQPPPQAANMDVAHAIAPAQAVPVHPQPTNQGLDHLLAGLNLG